MFNFIVVKGEIYRTNNTTGEMWVFVSWKHSWSPVVETPVAGTEPEAVKE